MTAFLAETRQEFRQGKLAAKSMANSQGHAFGCYNPKQWADYLGIPHQKIYAQMQTWSLYRVKELLFKMMVFQAAEQIKAVQKKVQRPNRELTLLCQWMIA